MKMISTSFIKAQEKANINFESITYGFASTRANLHPFLKFNTLGECFSEVAAFYDGSALSHEVQQTCAVPSTRCFSQRFPSTSTQGNVVMAS